MHSITKPVSLLEWETLRGKWPHLDDLPPLRNAGGRIDLLIGLDHAAFITPTDIRMRKANEQTVLKPDLVVHCKV